MRMYRVLMDGREIAGRVLLADKFFSRLKGLVKMDSIDSDEGLIIRPCSQIHTLGMKFSIDVLFLAKSGEVIHMESSLAPGNVTKPVSKSYQVIELKSGTIDRKSIQKGKIIALDPMLE